MNSKFEQSAKYAVGSVLLFRESPRGGSSGAGIDERRARNLAAEQLDGEALYAVLLAVAEESTKRAERELHSMRWEVLRQLEELAEVSDSLSIHRFHEKLKAEVLGA